MKKSISMLAVIATLGLLSACSKDKKENSNPPPTNIGGYVCPSGSTMQPNNKCLYPNGYTTDALACPAGTTVQNNQCYYPNGTTTAAGGTLLNNVGASFYSENWRTRNLTITNGGVFESFLNKAMGVCDRAHANGGTASCSSWVSGGLDLVLQSTNAQNNTMRITFRAFPQTNMYYNYSYQLPSLGEFFAGMFGFPIFSNTGAMKNPLPLDLTVSVINNNQGFEGRGYGDYYTAANRSLMQLIVNNGKLENTSFDYQFAFEGQVMATGNFIRCTQPDCGTVQLFGF